MDEIGGIQGRFFLNLDFQTQLFVTAGYSEMKFSFSKAGLAGTGCPGVFLQQYTDLRNDLSYSIGLEFFRTRVGSIIASYASYYDGPYLGQQLDLTAFHLGYRVAFW